MRNVGIYRKVIKKQILFFLTIFYLLFCPEDAQKIKRNVEI